MKRKTKILFSILLIFLSIFICLFIVRFWNSYEWDEGVYYTSSLRIIEGTEKFTADPIPQYLFSLLMIFVSSSIWIAPALNAISLIMIVILFFSICKNLNKNKNYFIIGVLALIGFTPVIDLISWRQYNIFLLFEFVSLFLFTKYKVNKNINCFFLCFIFLAFSFYSKNLSIIFISSFMLILLFYSDNLGFKNKLLGIFLFIIIVIPTIIIRFIFAKFSIINTFLITDFYNLWMMTFSDIYTPYINQIFPLRSTGFIEFLISSISTIFLIYLIYGLLSIISRKESTASYSVKKFILFLSYTLLLFFYAFYLLGFQLQSRYIMIFLPFIFLSISLIIEFLPDRINRIVLPIVILYIIISIFTTVIPRHLIQNIDYVDDLKQMKNVLGNYSGSVVSPTPASQIYLKQKILVPARDFSFSEGKCYFSWDKDCIYNILNDYNATYIILRNSQYWEEEVIGWTAIALNSSIKHYRILNNPENNYLIFKGKVLSLYYVKLDKNLTKIINYTRS